MKNKVMKLLLLSLLMSLLLAGCKGCGSDEEAKSDSVPEETEDYAQDEEYEDEDGDEVLEDYTLEDIAELNGVSTGELNYLMSDGRLIFLGEKYGDEIIENSDDALRSLEHVYSLTGLDGVLLEYNRQDVSPVTGNTVYTFYQVSETELDGEMVAARFFNSLIKVIVDKDGQLVGLSADINTDEDASYTDPDYVLTRDEAVAYVESLIGDGSRRVYGDEALYAFWDDEGTSRTVSEGKVTPAWLIHADADLKESAGKPYVVYVISLNPSFSLNDNDEYEMNPAVMSKFYTDTLSDDEYMGVYTSVFYFDGMKDAGEYTYTVDLSWVKENYPGYTGEKEMEIKVPVMYREEEGLYYLGSLDKKITLSNAYDFLKTDTTNAYVTDDPENIDSWHFQLDEAVDGSTGKYFDNPNYVLSSFSVMVDVWDNFYNEYGLDSVDGSGLPTMLLVYGYDEEYPEKEEDLMENACNMGQKRDWQVMLTSPALPACLDHVVMSHEYTHGINSQLTMSQYMNGPGAVMEGYADVIGYYMGALREYPECTGEYEWSLSALYSDEMRHLSDPEIHYNPKYIWGNYYVNPVEASVEENQDHGGVHTNSGVLGYLAYCFTEGMDGDDADTLTYSENLNIWFDTLYYTNYQTDYYDLAGYLKLSARSLGLSEGKQQYIDRVLKAFGMLPDENGEFNRTLDEESVEYVTSVIYDDSVFSDLDEAFPLGISYIDSADNVLSAGSTDYEGTNVYRVAPECEIVSCYISVGNQETGGEMDSFILDEEYITSTYQTIVYGLVPLALDSEFTTPEGYELVGGGASIGDIIYNVNEDGTVDIYAAEEGSYFMALKSNDSTDEAASYMILHFFIASQDYISEILEE